MPNLKYDVVHGLYRGGPGFKEKIEKGHLAEDFASSQSCERYFVLADLPENADVSLENLVNGDSVISLFDYKLTPGVGKLDDRRYFLGFWHVIMEPETYLYYRNNCYQQ